LFGSFLEHLGRAIHEGIYDPASSLSDENGFRKDVAEEVRQLGFQSFDIPAGISSPATLARWCRARKDRPGTLDKAWNTIETKQFGTDEFLA